MAVSAKDRICSDPQVKPILLRMLPKGGNPRPRPSWRQCPGWPPDLFALTATLLDRLGAYAMPPFTFGWIEAQYSFSRERAAEIQRLGHRWRTTGRAPPAVQARWQALLHPTEAEARDRALARARNAAWLLAVADEASFAMGFAKASTGWDLAAGPQTSAARKIRDEVGLFAQVMFLEQTKLEEGAASDSLPGLPNTVCRMVPPSEACVQPKTNVPAVGITLRSLSHHLALLPPRSVVETEWLFAHPNQDSSRPLNLVVAPFPYVINGTAFRTASGCADDRNCYFTVAQEWLKGPDGRLISPGAFYEFLKALVLAARQEVSEVHGVVLPEGALPYRFAKAVADELARRRVADGFGELELFISGVTSETPSTGSHASWTFTARLHGDAVLKPWRQKKHHRWRLDAGQIRRYQLGHVLDPGKTWWEQIDVNRRTCKFTVIRPGAALAVLVCEDLARTEPVMPAINAVGPNLVIALLMDGPQLESRWSARYATVLADDPGCSVLTLTCRGMIRRSSATGFRGPDAIGLWKEYDGQATQLMLPDADHGLVISLTSHQEEQFTMDLRGDGGGTIRFKLSGIAPVRLGKDVTFDWLRTH